MRSKLFLLFLGTAIFGVGAWYLFRNGLPDAAADRIQTLFSKDSSVAKTHRWPPQKFENNILDLLKEIEIAESTVVVKTLPGDSVRDIRASFPQGRPLEWIVWHMCGAAQGTPYRIDDCYVRSDGKTCIIRFTSSSPSHPTVVLSLRRSSRYLSGVTKMAIIIANIDFAANRLHAEYLSFSHPLTFALLPLPRRASWTDVLLREHKKEVILLLPMEPAKPTPAPVRSSLIMLHHPDERVRALINSASSSFPSCTGFSNWGGARALQDSRILGIVFSEIKKRDGFFIERFESKESIALHLAREQGLKAAAVDHVIDTSLSRSAISEELMRYAAYAQKRGSCILESSATARFLGALTRVRPELSRNGVELVYVSDIINSLPR